MLRDNEIARSGQTKAEPVQERTLARVAPPVDIFENEHELLLVADLPGVDAEGLKVAHTPPELHIEGRQSLTGDNGVVFARTFRVDDSIDPDGISAELAQGVLRVHLKKSSALRPRRIAVKSA